MAVTNQPTNKATECDLIASMKATKLWKRLLPTASSLPLIYRRAFLLQRTVATSSMAAPSPSSPSPSLVQVLQSLASNDHSNNPNQFFLLDGGTGEELFRRGVPDDRKIWSATAVVRPEYHEVLEQVHHSFLQAGAQAITTNSYGIVPGVGFEDPKERSRLLGLAGAIARQAVKCSKRLDSSSSSSPAFVLGSLGPLVESYRADLIRPHAQGVEDYQVACQALQPHVDAFLVETMSCWEESHQALEAVASMPLERRLPVMVSYSLDSKGNTRDGKLIPECIRNVLDYATQHNLQRKLP